MEKATYDPSVFAVADMQQAMSIILTPEDSTTEARWKNETGYLADLIVSRVDLAPTSVVLDYGCGIGRIARELIRRTGCSVIGVDISPQMRVLSPQYVQSERFSSCSPDILDALIRGGLKVEAAVSVWVLQHCLQPAIDISRLRDVLAREGSVFLVNNILRAVPTAAHGWVNDGVDIRKMMSEAFVLSEGGRLEVERTTPQVAQHSFWAHFRAR